MNKIFSSALCLTILLFFLTGCYESDKIVVIEHPSSVDASSTFNAVFINVFVYLTNGSKVTNPVNRDSFHLLAGLPSGFSVKSASSVVLNSQEALKFLNNQDSSQLVNLISEIMLSSLLKMKSMSANPSLETAFRGRTIKATDNGTKSDIIIKTDSIDQWYGFSSPEVIHFDVGEKVDTCIPFDSIHSILAMFGSENEISGNISELLDDPIYSALIDTIGIKIVPVITILQISASQFENSYNLMYFTKTGPLPANYQTSSEQSLFSFNDEGSMIAVPLTIKSTLLRKTKTFDNKSNVSFITNSAARSVMFQIASNYDCSIKIFSIEGRLITNIASQHRRQVLWNGTDRFGNKVSAGSYIVKYTDGISHHSGMVQFY